jgi:hypothetical protein
MLHALCELSSLWADFVTVSPHVAGLAAYLMSLEGSTTPADVVARIKALATTTGATTKSAGKGSTTLIAYNGDGF